MEANKTNLVPSQYKLRTMDIKDFVVKYRYLIIACVVIFVFLTFLLCLYFLVFKKKTQHKYEKLALVEEQKGSDDNNVEFTNLADIDEEVQEHDELDDEIEALQDGYSLTSDDDILNSSDGKKEKKQKKRHSLFAFGKPKYSTEKTTLLQMSQSSTDLSYSGSSMTPPTQVPSRSRSMESIMSSLSYSMETFGDNLSTCRLNIYAKYNPETWVLTFGCRQAECVLNTIESTSYWNVHMTLLPFKKERFKTRTKPTLTPIFDETFKIDNIAKPVLPQVSIRYRLYGRTTESGPKRMAGEINVNLGPILDDENYEISEWRTLLISNDNLKKTKRGKFLSIPTL